MKKLFKVGNKDSWATFFKKSVHDFEHILHVSEVCMYFVYGSIYLKSQLQVIYFSLVSKVNQNLQTFIVPTL